MIPNLPQGDAITFEKTDGPPWLMVDPDGTLSGMPEAGDVGENSFTVRVTDIAGAFVEATLLIDITPTMLWLDANGSESESGAPAAVDWDAPQTWSTVADGGTDTIGWIDEAHAVLSAGVDAAACTITLAGDVTVAGLTAEEGTPVLTGGALLLSEADAVFDILAPTRIESPVSGLNLHVTGSEPLTLAHPDNTLAGDFVVSSGTLDVAGVLAVAGTAIVEDNAVLTGGGILNGDLTISGTLAPGDGTGGITLGPLTLDDGARIEWRVDDWTGLAGTGHDVVLTDSLAVTENAAITVVIDADAPTNFTDQAMIFTLASAANGITGFDPADFTIDASAFPAANGHWTLEEEANELRLRYTPLTPYEQWRLASFSPDHNNPLVAGDFADPDTDGLANLVEYALGNDPNEADTSGITGEMTGIEGLPFLRMTIPRNPDATDITYTVQATADLTDPDSWTDTGLLIEQDTPELLVVRDTVGGPLRFMRLKISH